MYVPVVSKTGKPLMPCHPARARELVRKGRAVRRFLHGIFYIQLVDRDDGEIQPVACGVDPGSKKEGWTVKSKAHTYLNIQADAVTYVSDRVTTKAQLRRGRRYRKTPCRANRKNRARGSLPPSTKARWQWKLRLARWLFRLYPIAVFVVEDVKARTKGQRRWDRSFSPLEVGKHWFYSELSKLAPVETKSGWDTKQLRDALGLKKIGNKQAEVFEAHCVDSWVLANGWTGGHIKPDNTRLLCMTPLQFHRRQLHRMQPDKGGIRMPYGGTRSLGFKRGSLVKHPRFGVTYVGGFMKDRISLHRLTDGKRLCRNAKPSDCKFLAFNSWRARLIPRLKSLVSAA
ncbi:RRXRR domain-containing protein [Methylothermus subterraneus]